MTYNDFVDISETTRASANFSPVNATDCVKRNRLIESNRKRGRGEKKSAVKVSKEAFVEAIRRCAPALFRSAQQGSFERAAARSISLYGLFPARASIYVCSYVCSVVNVAASTSRPRSARQCPANICREHTTAAVVFNRQSDVLVGAKAVPEGPLIKHFCFRSLAPLLLFLLFFYPPCIHVSTLTDPVLLFF